MNTRRLRGRFYRKTGGPRGIGGRCKVYCAGCIVCESYRYLERHGRFPTFEEVGPIADEESRKDHEAWLLTEDGKLWALKAASKEEA